MKSRTGKCIVAALLALVLLSGCTTSVGYTWELNTGDKVKVKLDTSDGWKMTSELPFEISDGEQTIAQGQFIDMATYVQYATQVSDTEGVTLLDEGETEQYDYVFWTIEHESDFSEYDYAILIKNSDGGASNVGVIMSSTISEESARECLSRLTFEVTK